MDAGQSGSFRFLAAPGDVDPDSVQAHHDAAACAEIMPVPVCLLPAAAYWLDCATMARPIPHYSDFWLFYLAEHAKPVTRAIHYAGTAITLAALVAGLMVDPRWFLLMPIAGYGFAWTAHFTVEHNRPATFRYPLWSLASDYRMFFLWMTGRLAPHLKQAGVAG